MSGPTDTPRSERCLDLETIERYVTEGSSDRVRDSVEGHVAACEDCAELLTDVTANQDLLERARQHADALTQQLEIRGYRILGEIGRGGMGVVFEAEQLEPERRVALKVLSTEASIDEARRRLFDREIASLARLEHEGIASIYDVGTTSHGDRYFSMELVRGTSLLEYAAKNDLTLRDRLELGRQICRAVAYSHRRGVVHRDLKPSNILVDDERRVRVLDFGVARILTTSGLPNDETVAGQIRGTPAYMSPEQALGLPERVDGRSDVYSVGVLLYELLSGALPYDLQGIDPTALASAIASKVPPPPSQLAPNLGPDVDALVLRALEKAPAARYQTVDELADELTRTLSGRPVRARRRAPRRRRLAAIAAVVLVTLGVVLVSRAFFGSRDGDGGPIMLVMNELERGAPSEAERLAARYLDRDGLAAHPELIQFFERRLDQRPDESPEVWTQTLRTLALLFFCRPNESPEDTRLSAGLRRRMLELHASEADARDRLQLASALGNCGTPAELPVLLRRAEQRVHEGTRYAVEELRSSIWAGVSLVRRAERAGYRSELVRLDFESILSQASAAAVNAGSPGPNRALKNPIECLFRAVAFFRRRAGAEPLDVFPQSSLGIRPELVLSARADEALWSNLRRGPESMIEVSDAPNASDYIAYGKLVGSYDRIEHDSMIDALAREAALLRRRDVTQVSSKVNAGREMARLESSGAFAYGGADDDTRLGAFFDQIVLPFVELPWQRLDVEHPDSIADWDLGEPIPCLRGAVGPPMARGTPIRQASRNFARLGIAGISELKLPFQLQESDRNGSLVLSVELQKSARWRLPESGEAFFDVLVDEIPQAQRVRATSPSREFFSFPVLTDDEEHILRLRLHPDSNTTLRVYRITLRRVTR